MGECWGPIGCDDDWGCFPLGAVNGGCFSKRHLQNSNTPLPFTLRPNKAYRLKSRSGRPRTFKRLRRLLRREREEYSIFPHAYYRRPVPRRKQTHVDQSVHTSKTTSIVSPSSLYCALRPSAHTRPAPKTHTLYDSPYTETQRRVHRPPSHHQTRLQTDSSETHDKTGVRT